MASIFLNCQRSEIVTEVFTFRWTLEGSLSGFSIFLAAISARRQKNAPSKSEESLLKSKGQGTDTINLRDTELPSEFC